MDVIVIFLFQVVRSSLMPGILKTVGHNKDHRKPIKVVHCVYVAYVCKSIVLEIAQYFSDSLSTF